jgi:hypothetical protein
VPFCTFTDLEMLNKDSIGRHAWRLLIEQIEKINWAGSY